MLAKPELLAPAGDEESLKAAVAAGADAVYFGLRGGFNARARADNIAVEDLPRVFDYLHARGVQGFVTFNTLVFDKELPVAEEALAALAKANADAIIVQDLGAARLAKAICPELSLHASTQMTVSSAEGAEIAKALGITRVVLPRELSIEEIRTFAKGTDLELEVFVHGALCVSWSGQCLTSEALQSRSANRGQCAQSCRLPYELLLDGARTTPRGDDQLKYLLSPKDLAAYDLLPELIDAGVTCFKIEGRMKGPEYVANVVDKYRRALDAAVEKRAYPLSAHDEEDLRYSFSRSFSHGFLKGSDHQHLVHGLFPGHRGVLVGRVDEVSARAGHVFVQPEAIGENGAPASHGSNNSNGRADSSEGLHGVPRGELARPTLKAGDRILFDQGKPEDDEPRGGLHACDVLPDGRLKLVFGTSRDEGSGPDLRLVKVGDVVWKAKDAEVTRQMKRIAAQERKVDLALTVHGALNAPLKVTARDALGRTAEAQSSMPLQAALGKPLHENLLREKLGAFGETPFALRTMTVEIDGALAMPPSELKRLRRALTDALEGQKPPMAKRSVTTGHELDAVVPPIARVSGGGERAPKLVPLLRTQAQVEAALKLADELGIDEVELDFMELVGLGVAVETVRAAKKRAIVATPRVQKPGEEGYDHRFERLRPDGILARHLGALDHFLREARAGVVRPEGFVVRGDFSLNATNALTARTLLALGLDTLTPAYDLDLAQLLDLVRGVPAERLEVTLHQHLPLYHTEHCLYAHTLSNGADFRTCGRPCEKHLLQLQDHTQLAHPIIVDVGCRNTVFNARAQSAASCFPQLHEAGVRRYRVELVRETAEETAMVLRAYAALLQGKREARAVVREIGALERYGVTAGTLVVVTRAAG
ncbi:MAG: U32 family peptidase [Deltaproteobacteria bacterium]|nr:U32 family peptidase [Deltaproteobacteria bacterium]